MDLLSIFSSQSAQTVILGAVPIPFRIGGLQLGDHHGHKLIIPPVAIIISINFNSQFLYDLTQNDNTNPCSTIVK